MRGVELFNSLLLCCRVLCATGVGGGLDDKSRPEMTNDHVKLRGVEL